MRFRTYVPHAVRSGSWRSCIRGGRTSCIPPDRPCGVPGGGLSPAGQRWVPGRPGFCLPVRVLSRLFRRLCLDALRAAFDQGRLEFHGPVAPLADPEAFRRLLAAARTTAWEVYAQPPFGGPAQVLDYLGRYTCLPTGRPTGWPSPTIACWPWRTDT
jgi:hypothetical protein